MPFTAVLYCRFIVYEQFRRTTTRERCTMQTLPRDKPFFQEGHGRGGGRRGVKELFSSSKSRRGDSVLSRERGNLLSTTRKIEEKYLEINRLEKLKESRPEERRTRLFLATSRESGKPATCNCQFFPPPLLRENAFVPAQLISQGSRETPGMEEKSHNSSGWFGVERGEEALIRRNGTSLLRLVLHLLSTGVIGQDKVSLSRETINHPSSVLFICTNIASSHHPTVHLGCDTESGR